MYTDLESMIGLAFLVGILWLFVWIGFFVLIAVMIVRLAGRDRSGGQPPGAPGAQPNRGLLWLLTILAMAQGRQPGAGQPGSAELGARQSAIDAGIDPTPRP